MAEQMSVASMKSLLKERSARVECWLAHCLEGQGIPQRLRESMEYSLMAGGKRLRPVLCLTAAALCAQEDDIMETVLPFAAAIEMIHTYSLIHDDLPAMDDDDLRRGKPSNHKQFDEATAILAGDALLTDAFTVMCSVKLPAERVLRAVAEMSRAAGGSGMVGGQALDMIYTGGNGIDLDSLRAMHAMKTGAIIKASCLCGAILAGASDDMLTSLAGYGTAFGAAFQIADDILDITADTATLGKPAGSDVQQGKCTYPSLLGLDRSRQLAEEQRTLAVAHLNAFTGDEAAFLRSLADYTVSRTF